MNLLIPKYPITTKAMLVNHSGYIYSIFKPFLYHTISSECIVCPVHGQSLVDKIAIFALGAKRNLYISEAMKIVEDNIA